MRELRKKRKKHGLDTRRGTFIKSLTKRKIAQGAFVVEKQIIAVSLVS